MTLERFNGTEGSQLKKDFNKDLETVISKFRPPQSTKNRYIPNKARLSNLTQQKTKKTSEI